VNAILREPVRGLWLLVLVLFLLSAGCAPPADSTPPAAPPAGQAQVAAPPTAAVMVVKPVRKTMSYKIVQPGEIQAFALTPVYARISGYVHKVYKDIGDLVTEGEVLADLSVPEMDEELKQKQALVAQATAEIEQAKKLLGSAEADLKSAAARVREADAGRLRVNAELRRAESQYERMKNTSGVIAREVLDETRLGFEAARAAVTEVEARVGSAEAERVSREAKRDKAKTDISVAEAHLRVAQADEGHTAALLAYAKLRAPFAGVVTWRKVDPGHLLQPGAGGSKGEPIFVVAETDTVRIFLDVPENDAVLVSDGTPAVVSVQALNGEEFPGKVKRSAWTLDPKAGRTLRTEIDLKNADGRLRPGTYANATITVEHPNVLTVPAAAVVMQGEQPFCYRVEGGKAVRTPVRVGLRDAQFVEVMKRKVGKGAVWEDLTGQEEFVAGNVAALADGQPVTASHNP
jgi:RND family efflux transporter MFP subunit